MFKRSVSAFIGRDEGGLTPSEQSTHEALRSFGQMRASPFFRLPAKSRFLFARYASDVVVVVGVVVKIPARVVRVARD